MKTYIVFVKNAEDGIFHQHSSWATLDRAISYSELLLTEQPQISEIRIDNSQGRCLRHVSR